MNFFYSKFNIAIGNERNQILTPVGNHSKPIAAGFASKEAYLKERIAYHP
jgi:hypothetical protein